MTTSVAPGTPYNHLARKPGDSRKRTIAVLIAGTLVGGVLWALASTIVSVGMFAGADLLGGPRDADGIAGPGVLGELAMALLVLALFTPAVRFAARYVQGRPAGTLSSVFGRIRWGWLATCLLVAGPIAGLATPIAAQGSHGSFVGWGSYAVNLAVLVPLVVFQSAGEEYLCRGWLLQGLGAVFRRPWIPIGAQAIFWALMHGIGTPWGFGELVVVGCLSGWLAVRTGGLEASIVLHVVTNLLAFVLGAAILDDGVLSETAADSTWLPALVDCALTAGFALVVVGLFARRRGTRFSPAPPPDLGTVVANALAPGSSSSDKPGATRGTTSPVLRAVPNPDNSDNPDDELDGRVVELPRPTSPGVITPPWPRGNW